MSRYPNANTKMLHLVKRGANSGPRHTLRSVFVLSKTLDILNKKLGIELTHNLLISFSNRCMRTKAIITTRRQKWSGLNVLPDGICISTSSNSSATNMALVVGK